MNRQENDNSNMNIDKELMEELIAENVEPATAARLVREVPDVCRRQLSYLNYQDDLDDRAATLVASIEGDWPEPARSYWENAVQHAEEEKSTASPTATAATQEQPQATAEVEEHSLMNEPDEDVRNLLAALETIAVMSHAHRDDRSTPCPVCVAWDALKQWAHQKSLREE